MIYLDAAATSLQKPAAVRRAVNEAMTQMTSPGRGSHPTASRAAAAVYTCRERAARLLRVPEPERVVFTMNATHALNIAIRSIVSPWDPVVISGYEHNAVTRPLTALGAKLRVASGRLFSRSAVLEDFRRLLPGAKCAVCTHVSNVFGFVLPIYEIAALCREQGVPLIVDASQSAGVLELDCSTLQADFVAMPGHKSLLGVPGSGLLLCRGETKPLLFGGSGSDSIDRAMPAYLPERLEAGTQNAPAAAALAAGIRYIRRRGRDAIEAHERELCLHMAELLGGREELQLFVSSDAAMQSGVLSFRCRSRDCEEIARMLSQEEICVRSGLHCAPLAHECAGTLETGTVRMSFSPFNTHAEIEKAAGKLIKII